ncbi:MAG: GGDEF domain-containing protein [Acidiferrobacterales bacterium]
MSVIEFVSADPTLAQTIRRHLESLKRSGNGAGLARILERGLDQGGVAPGLQVKHGAVSRLHAQLGAFASDGDNPPALRIKARVIQQHLVPYLETTLLAPALHNPFQSYIDAINGIPNGPSPAPVSSVGVDIHPWRQIQASETAGADGLPTRRSAQVADSRENGFETEFPEWVEKAMDHGEAASDSEQRYRALRRSELGAWRAIYGAMKDFKSLKQLLAGNIDELRCARVDLEQRLTGATDRIKSVESDCLRLRAELDQARRRSTRAPRLPGITRGSVKRSKRAAALPRREVFLQQLVSEVERVRRLGGSLAVAVIGLEDLDSSFAHYGEDAGHAVLRCYVEEILAGFRTYDFVATFDRDRFAVLFPGTGREGAVRALAKAQKRATDTRLTLGGESLSLPGFFSAVGLLAAGEDAATLMTRVANAAEEARSVSPRHISVATVRGTDGVGPAAGVRSGMSSLDDGRRAGAERTP